ncbi:hypothetical protein NE237_017161 [Protea cynaroides]|uniref:Uncharacterized protein n=1 Tax=Protea cynaroides TaxID=273540 RepID=A0A9Q0K7I4_9MAGN|nr:hypothetical protein NE237_017161 [Protea cynaroides]
MTEFLKDSESEIRDGEKKEVECEAMGLDSESEIRDGGKKEVECEAMGESDGCDESESDGCDESESDDWEEGVTLTHLSKIDDFQSVQQGKPMLFTLCAKGGFSVNNNAAAAYATDPPPPPSKPTKTIIPAPSRLSSLITQTQICLLLQIGTGDLEFLRILFLTFTD